MRLTTFVATVFWGCSLSATIQAQGLVDGFMRGQRRASLAVFASQDTYDTYYINTTATKNPNLGTVTTQALTVVGTYGLSYDLDLIVAAPYIRTEANVGYFSKQEGFQDASAILRWEAFDYKLGKRSKLSWQFAVGYSMPIQNYVNDALLAIGHGSKNIDARTLLHFKTPSFFLTGQYGYIRRGQVSLDHLVNYYDPSQLNPYEGSKVNVPDVTELIIRGGFVSKRVNIDVWGQRQTPYNAGTNIGPSIPYPTNAVGFTKVGATAYLRILKQLGITAGCHTTLDGRNIGQSSQVIGGLIIGHWTANN